MICNDRKKWPGAAVPEEPGSSSYLCLHGLRILAPVEFAGVAGVRQFRQEDIVLTPRQFGSHRCPTLRSKEGTVGTSTKCVARERRLEQAANRLSPGTRIVIALEHFEFVPLDEVLSGEQRRRDFFLLD